MPFDKARYQERAVRRAQGKTILVKKTREWKTGYRFLTKRLEDHRDGKAIQFEYFDWILWLPAASVFQMPDGRYITSYYQIENAKQHPSARRN